MQVATPWGEDDCCRLAPCSPLLPPQQVVHSRTFGAPGPQGGVGVRMLVPLIDMLNHGRVGLPLRGVCVPTLASKLPVRGHCIWVVGWGEGLGVAGQQHELSSCGALADRLQLPVAPCKPLQARPAPLPPRSSPQPATT